jgi:hypothetical protein
MAGVEGKSDILEVAGAGITECNGTYSKNLAAEDDWFCSVIDYLIESSLNSPVAVPPPEVWHKAVKHGNDLDDEVMYVVIRNFYTELESEVIHWVLGRSTRRGLRVFYEGENHGADTNDFANIAWKGETEGETNLPLLRRISDSRKRKAEHMSGVMETAWKQRKFTDAEVICNGKRIPVHRSTLAAASPVFEAAFSSVMQEGASAVYEIKDSTPEAVEAMLHSVYTGELPEVELLPPFFELAMRYELEGSANAAAAQMAESVSVSNVKEILRVLHLHSPTVESAKEAFERVIRRVKSAPTNELFIAIL